MKLSNLCTGFALSFALGTVTTALAARMAWPAFGPRGRAALCALVALGAVIAVVCRWLGRRSTRSHTVCGQLAAMTSAQMPLLTRFDESRRDELSLRLNDLLTHFEDMLDGAIRSARDIGAGAQATDEGTRQAVATAETQTATLATDRRIVAPAD